MFEKEPYKYPLAEFFVSPQGEGEFTGTMMQFIRLAGCTVGKPYAGEKKIDETSKSVPIASDNKYDWNKSHIILPIYTEECTLYDGRTFPCDTDYRASGRPRLTAAEIAAKVDSKSKHACITGGEPMMHPLLPLIDELQKLDMEVHLETSGTIPLEKNFPDFTTHAGVWITCSPKFGVLPDVANRADEVKLLVDENFDPGKLIPEIAAHRRVYIQPVNGERSISVENLRRCMDWQKKYPKWRLSLQLHKVLEQLLHERVL